MPALRDVEDAARIYGPARSAAAVTLALMVLVVLYAIRIVVTNWTEIGV